MIRKIFISVLKNWCYVRDFDARIKSNDIRGEWFEVYCREVRPTTNENLRGVSYGSRDPKWTLDRSLTGLRAAICKNHWTVHPRHPLGMQFYTSVSLELKVYSLRSIYVTDEISPFRIRGSRRFRRKKAQSKTKSRKKGKRFERLHTYMIDVSAVDS
jgi:hypothetical protein